MDGSTGLHTAAKHGNTNVVKLLLSHGMDVDILDASGWTPLHYACCFGQQVIVNLLLESGATINAQNQEGEVWKHCDNALFTKSPQSDPPALTNIRDSIGYTPMQYATIELAERLKNVRNDSTSLVVCAHRTEAD
eukprot:763624-Hanusia_phi.AAC.3